MLPLLVVLSVVGLWAFIKAIRTFGNKLPKIELEKSVGRLAVIVVVALAVAFYYAPSLAGVAIMTTSAISRAVLFAAVVFLIVEAMDFAAKAFNNWWKSRRA